MKPIIALFFAAFYLSSLHAQVPPAYRADYNNMMSKTASRLAFDNFQRSSMNMNFFKTGKVSDMTFYFKIKLKDNSTKELKSCLYFDTTLKKTYVVYIDKNFSRRDSGRKQKIYCDEVMSVIGSMGPMEDLLRGVVTDSCWLFQTLTGKINVYSIYPANSNNSSIAAVQYGDGNIEAWDADKLKTLISANEGALKKFERKNFFNAIKAYNKAE